MRRVVGIHLSFLQVLALILLFAFTRTNATQGISSRSNEKRTRWNEPRNVARKPLERFDKEMSALWRMKGNQESLPRLLKPWIFLNGVFPRLNVPFVKMDLALTLASALVFVIVDFFTAIILQRTLNDWSKNAIRTSAGSITTILHSSVLVVGLYSCLYEEKYSPSSCMNDHPYWWQDAASAIIQFCTGYMLYDVAVQLIYDRWVPGSGPVLSTTDMLFLAHHMATILYMTSARFIGAGHMSAMSLMLVGEVTAPLMNLLRISNVAVQLKSPVWLISLQQPISFLYSFCYVGCRAFLGPLLAIQITYDLIFTSTGRKNVPVQLSIVWGVMCWAVILGSVPWIMSALNILLGNVEIPVVI